MNRYHFTVFLFLCFLLTSCDSQRDRERLFGTRSNLLSEREITMSSSEEEEEEKLPDLIITSLTVPLILPRASSTTVDISYTVKNQGPLATGKSFKINFYLSQDPTIDTSDSIFGSRTINALDPNISFSETCSFIIDTTIFFSGQGAIVDTEDEIQESDELNNTKYFILIDY